MRKVDEGSVTKPPGKGMRWIPTGEFRMGSEDFYPEEAPVTQVALDGFWIDERPVTVAEFRRFVRATGHVTVAERPLDAEQYPEADPDLLCPARSSSTRRRDLSTLTTIRTGGRTFPARTGAILRARTRRSMGETPR